MFFDMEIFFTVCACATSLDQAKELNFQKRLLECVNNALPTQLPALVETRQFVDDLTTMSVANSEDDVTHSRCSVALELQDVNKFEAHPEEKQVNDRQPPQRPGEESSKNPQSQRSPYPCGRCSARLGH